MVPSFVIATIVIDRDLPRGRKDAPAEVGRPVETPPERPGLRWAALHPGTLLRMLRRPVRLGA